MKSSHEYCMKSHEIHWNPMSSGQPMLNQHFWWLSFSNEFGLFMAFPPSVNSDVSNSSQVLEVWPSSSTCATGTGTWDSRQENAWKVGLKMDGGHQIGQLDPLSRKIYVRLSKLLVWRIDINIIWKGPIANHSFVAILPSLGTIDWQGVSLRLNTAQVDVTLYL